MDLDNLVRFVCLLLLWLWWMATWLCFKTTTILASYFTLCLQLASYNHRSLIEPKFATWVF